MTTESAKSGEARIQELEERLDELDRRLLKEKMRAAYYYDLYGAAAIAWRDTRKPTAVVQALRLSDGTRGPSYDTPEEWWCLYDAVSSLKSPAEAVRRLAEVADVQPESFLKRLVAWRNDFREERQRLEKNAASGRLADLYALERHRLVDLEVPIPNPATLYKV